MDHAEAHERLLDLALEPGAIDRLDTDASPDAGTLRAHVAMCGRCRADVASWRIAHDALRTTIADAGGAVEGEDARIAAPDSLRSAVAALTAMEPTAPMPVPTARTDGARSRRASPVFALVAAAAVVFAVGATILAIGQGQQAGASQQATAELTALARAMTDVLADPDHGSVPLHGLDGAQAGLAAWSPAGYVIVSRALPPPPAGSEYRCWFEVDGDRTPIGTMRSTGDLAYWWGAAALDDGGWSGGPPVIGVSLEQVGGGGGGGPAVLTSAIPA